MTLQKFEANSFSACTFKGRKCFQDFQSASRKAAIFKIFRMVFKHSTIGPKKTCMPKILEKIRMKVYLYSLSQY